MSYPDHPGWPESREPGRGDDPHGRQRARHPQAAPDAYPGSGDDGEFRVDFDRAPDDRADDRADERADGPRPRRRARSRPGDEGASGSWSLEPGGTWPPGQPLDDGQSLGAGQAFDAGQPFDGGQSSDAGQPGSWQQHEPGGPWGEPAGRAGHWGEPGATAQIPAVSGGPYAAAPPAAAPYGVGMDDTARWEPIRADDTARYEPIRVDAPAGDPVPGGPDDAAAAPEAAQKPPGRAGRNLPAAIGVGVGLGAVVIASLFIRREVFLLVVIAAICVATWELARAVRPSGARPPLVPLVGGGVGMAVLAWLGGAEALTLGLLATVLAAMLWRLSDGPVGFQRDLSASVLIAAYIPFLGGFAVLLLAPPDGAWRVLVTVAGVVLSDTGGYITGVFLGKHPMAPSVSPKKSWEGFGGSLAASAAGGALLLYFLLDVAPWYGALFGLCVAAASVVGDLAESLLKRDLGIKDMSNLLPGHGGLMDRLDSVLFALPVGYTILALVASGGG